MKIGILNGPSAAVCGGTEFCAAVLAEHLGQQHDIEILHEKPALTLQDLESFYGAPLPRTAVLPLPKIPPAAQQRRWAWQRSASELQHAKSWSGKYELFIAYTHTAPPFCFARRNIIICLFPFDDDLPRQRPHDTLVGRLRTFYHQRMWQRRMDCYDTKLAISEYSQLWAKKRWGVDCGILYPPCNTDFGQVEKKPQILSVGRFTALKSQVELLKAYRELRAEDPHCWDYRSVGPLGRDSESLAYFEEVKQIAEVLQVPLECELSRSDLNREFETASIFWHGAGFTNNVEAPPQLAEHFGITTVEAMAAGCVPLVYNKGGQPELVRHGIDGFVWNNAIELVDYTRRLQADPLLLGQMSESSRVRAQNYSRASYLSKVDRLLEVDSE